jgi:Ni2+-binding GTPase involved in maturation of urease and hydrogenase
MFYAFQGLDDSALGSPWGSGKTTLINLARIEFEQF